MEHSPILSLMEGFPSVVTLPVQWGDMDSLAHVNNVVYIRWLESGRVALIDSIAEIVASKQQGVGPILASVQCDYRRQTRFPDTIHVGSRVDHVGRSSLRVAQRIVSEQERDVVAEGVAVLVLYNYFEGKSVPIEGDLREVLTRMVEQRPHL